MRPLRLLAALIALLPLSALGQAKKTLGIFLPTTLADGEERFRYGEALASELSKALDTPVVAKSFGRFEDYEKAAAEGALDWAVVDSWAVAQSKVKFEPIALGVVAGETHQRWAVVATSRVPVKDLAGKRLAITKGATNLEQRFVSHVVFGGDLNAPKHFKLVAVPTVDSALKMMEAKNAEAALVPLRLVPKDMPVVYRSPRIMTAVFGSIRGGNSELKTVLTSLGAFAPFDRFVDIDPQELAELRKLIAAGPPKRQPFMAESPLVRVDASTLVNFHKLGFVLPAFTEYIEIPSDQPNE